MSSTGLEVFDKTIQETSIWLKRIMEQMETDDRHVAYTALKAVGHALRDRIGPENAAHLGAQLPMLVRGVFFEGWHISGTPTKERHKKQFLDHVRADLPETVNAEQATKAVFGVIWEKVDPGEVSKVIRMFPSTMRELWPISLDEERRA